MKYYFSNYQNFKILFYDFNLGNANDLSGNENHGKINNCIKKRDVIKVPRTIIPHRVKGKMFCLPHEDEGLITNKDGKQVWAKGDTTARNEKRFVHQMQQGKWDYKSDGIKQLKYENLDLNECLKLKKYVK